MSVLLFPEGTDFSDNALAKSDAYADAKGLPCYTRLLHPKTAGFVACVQALGERLDAVYDATVAYTPHPLAAAAADPRPSEHDFPRGTLPRTVLLDVRRVPRAALPAASDEEGLARWLLERWARKEELLVNGLAGEGGEGGEGGPTAPPRASLALEYVAVLLGWMAALGTLRWLQPSPLPWASPPLSSPPSSSPFPSASRSPSPSTPLTLTSHLPPPTLIFTLTSALTFTSTLTLARRAWMARGGLSAAAAAGHCLWLHHAHSVHAAGRAGRHGAAALRQSGRASPVI